jgi:hypothetical protein
MPSKWTSENSGVPVSEPIYDYSFCYCEIIGKHFQVFESLLVLKQWLYFLILFLSKVLMIASEKICDSSTHWYQAHLLGKI